MFFTKKDMIWSQNAAKETLPRLKFKSERICLSPPRMQDADQWIQVRSKNRENLQALEPIWPKNCLNQAFFEKRLKRQAQDWKNDLAYSFLIFLKRSGPLIGGININHVCRGAAQYASLGYWLDQDYQGQGYMTEAMRLILKFSFENINLHRVNAAVLPINQRSIKLLVRNGFQQEGLAEKYIKINGIWHDHVLFGLPIETWKEDKKRPQIHYS